MNNKNKILIASIVMVIAIFIIYNFSKNNNIEIVDGDYRNFNFSYSVELDESSEKVEVWIPIPKSTEVQTITNVNLDSGGIECAEYVESEHKNKYYYCSADLLASDTKVTLTCDVKRVERQGVVYGNIDNVIYKKGTSVVPVGLDKFKRVIDKNDLTSSNINNVYQYVLNGMHYGKPTDNTADDIYYSGMNSKTNTQWLPDIEYGENKVKKDVVVELYKAGTVYSYANGNSNYACDIGVGNCTDYHSYFISLCRTLDVPARFHMGFPIPSQENEGKVKGYHCWAEYYEDGQWHPVDISEADKDPSKADYFFGTLDNDRVGFTTGRDLVLVNHTDPVNFFGYPIVKGTTYNKMFYYKNL